MQLNIKLDRDEEKQLLEAVKAGAEKENISLKEFVLNALKNHLAAQTNTQPVSPKSFATKIELDEVKRRIIDFEIGLMGELRKNKKEIEEQIAVLAQAIAAIESRLDDLNPPSNF